MRELLRRAGGCELQRYAGCGLPVRLERIQNDAVPSRHFDVADAQHADFSLGPRTHELKHFTVARRDAPDISGSHPGRDDTPPPMSFHYDCDCRTVYLRD